MTAGNKTKTRIGILGTGFGANHARIYASFPDVEVVGIAGRDEGKTQAAADSLGIPGTTDPMALVNSPVVDAIDVCTPTRTHAQYVTAALAAEKDVFCETPVAHSLSEAQQMAQAAAANSRLLLVALFGRFLSDYKGVREYMETGRLGEPRLVYANRRTPPVWGGGWDDNFILDLMLHDIDYIVWLLGKPATVTSCGFQIEGGGWNHVDITLAYNGVSAKVEGCGMMPASFPFSTSLRVVGDEGAVDLNWYWGGEAPVSEVKFFPEKGDPEILDFPGYDPYEAECRYFVDCIRGIGDPNLLGIKTACESLEVALAAKESLKRDGQRIRL